MSATVDDLVAEKLAHGAAWLDAVVAVHMSALIASGLGAETDPSVLARIRQGRERLHQWRREKLVELHAALVAEADCFMRYQMANETPGRIVRFEDRDGQVIATDEKGRKFTTPAGRFDWRPLDEPAKPQAPTPSRWRRAA